jgi:putative transposase
MKKSRFTEDKIIGLLRDAEAGAKVPGLCRRNGISEAAYCNVERASLPNVQRARRLQPRGVADRDRHQPARSTERAGTD